MEFLRRHWEKIVLGVCLVVILTWSMLLLRNLQQVRNELSQWQEQNSGVINTAEKEEFSKLAPSDFNAGELLSDARLQWQVAEDAKKGSLVDPRRLVVCSYPSCDGLVFYEAEDCAVCGRVQVKVDPVGPGPKPSDDEDSDADGIPDEVENRYDFLDPDFAYDAGRDHDQDTYTNLEEYLSGTAMDDAKSHPPLALRLRLHKTERRAVPMVLTTVNTNGVDDKEKWSIWVNVYDQRGAWRSRNIKFGERLGAYTVTDVRHLVKEEFNKKLNIAMPVDRSEVVLTKTDGSTLTLVRNTTTYEEGATAFRFLQPPDQPTQWRQFVVRSGDVLELRDSLGQIEQYRVEDIRLDGATVRRLGTVGEAGSFVIGKFDPVTDMPAQRRNQAEMDAFTQDGMPMPGTR